MPKETRDDRVAKLKQKFLSLHPDERIDEYVRYNRAAKGELPHELPQEYIEECRDALYELLFEDYGKVQALDFLDFLIEQAEENPSRPFIHDPDSKDD